MRHLPAIALGTLSALAFATSPGHAQVIFGPGMEGIAPRSNEGSAHEERVPVCQASGGGTRTRSNCEVEPDETTVLRSELEFKIPTLPLTLPTGQCEAVGETAYQQRNSVARINSTIEIEDCTAAAGTFTISLRIRDETGENKTLEFTETWERSDDQDVTFTSDYPIGENVQLLRARMHGLSCTCADAQD